jgi:hypothetical protein
MLLILTTRERGRAVNWYCLDDVMRPSFTRICLRVARISCAKTTIHDGKQESSKSYSTPGRRYKDVVQEFLGPREELGQSAPKEPGTRPAWRSGTPLPYRYGYLGDVRWFGCRLKHAIGSDACCSNNSSRSPDSSKAHTFKTGSFTVIHFSAPLKPSCCLYDRLAVS